MNTQRIAFLLAIGGALSVNPAFSQADRNSTGVADYSMMEGTVVTVSNNTMVLRTSDGEYQLFVFDRNAARPTNLEQGARVRVDSRPYERDVRMARTVMLSTAADRAGVNTGANQAGTGANQAGTGANQAGRNQQPASGAGAGADRSARDSNQTQAGNQTSGGPDTETPGGEPIPPEVRKLERQIERQARRYRAGVHAGAGLDPEILIGGVHAQLGPIFNENVTFRPGLDFGIGEVSTYAALNLEAIYRLPLTARGGQWSAYAGAGPGLNFIDQNFSKAEQGEREIDFNDFDFDPSFNFLAGVELRSGVFVELKSAAFGRPHTRLMFGIHF